MQARSSTLQPHQPRTRTTLPAIILMFATALVLTRRTSSVAVPDAAIAETNQRHVRTTIDPNTATAAELTTLPGIGPKRAADIIALRKELSADTDTHQPFRSADDLELVKGIGPKTVAKLGPYLRFNNQPAPPSRPEAPK
jgi:competence ComEA-like helix-hairpin-helix protein